MEATITTCNAKAYDTLLLHHLCFPDLEHGLGFIASQLLQKQAWKHLSGVDELTYNCLAKDTLVPTENGIKQISLIKAGDRVWSWREDEGIILATVSSVLKRRNAKVQWLALKIEGSLDGGGRWGTHKLVLTPDHRVLTKQGWKKAETLTTEDYMLLPRRGSDSLIHGTLLGDGHASPKKRLCFTQANEGWAKAKAGFLGREPGTRNSVLHGEVFPRWETEVGISGDWRKRFYTGRGIRKNFLPPPDDAAFAVWYADDGCLAGGVNPRFACQAFDIEEVRSWFQQQFGDTISVYNELNIAIRRAGCEAFFSRIAPWLHPSMEYKLPPEYRGRYNGWMEKNVAQQWGRVSSIENFEPKRRGTIQMEYCLTVPETGCFFTADGLVANCRDTDSTLQIVKQLMPMARHERVLDLYENVSVPLALICSLMSETGFRIDPARLKTVRADLEHKSQELEAQLPAELKTREVPIRKRQLAPPGTLSEKTKKPLKYVMVDSTKLESPWKSPDALKVYLYETCKLPVQTHAKTGEATTDKTAIPKLLRAASRKTYEQEMGLERTSEVLRGLRALQSIRQIASLLSTFTKEEYSTVERIHASFLVHGTSSGRLSSSGPNMQNWPESSRFICVPSQSDWVIVNADFSSLENRLTAFFAQDFDRLDRLAVPGFNEHKWTASQFFDIPVNEVIKDNAKDAPYGMAKRINHGKNYCMGALKIAKLFDLEFGVVKPLCDTWNKLNAKTVQWQVETGERVKRDGYLTNPFGRKRWLYSSNSYTEGASFLPQSTGAELIIRAMIGLMYDRVHWPEERVAKLMDVYVPLPRPARLLVSVHDSLVVECPISVADEVIAAMKRVMEQGWRELGGFAIPVEVTQGPSWGECH